MTELQQVATASRGLRCCSARLQRPSEKDFEPQRRRDAEKKKTDNKNEVEKFGRDVSRQSVFSSPSFFSAPLRLCGKRSSRASGYTLVELFLTLAVLMVVLGLMINLSNRVRRESADHVTRKMLSELTIMMAQYQHDNDGQLPPIMPLIDAGGDTQPVTEPNLQAVARLNNADVFRYLRLGALANRKATRDDSGVDSLGSEIRQSASDRPVLEDPWGTPIVFMQSQHPAIGMAPGNVFFFVSAGPDRQFLTHDDNLYSYDETAIVRNDER